MSDHTEDAGVIVEGSMTVSEQDRDAYLALIKMVVEASKIKSGCVKFAVSEDMVSRNLFHLIELWTDMESLDASRFSHENVAMLHKMAPLDIRDRKVLIHQITSTERG